MESTHRAHDGLAGKRLLFVITKSNWGGAQSYVYALALRFRDEGADVAVALGGTGTARSKPGLLAERLSDAGIRTIPLPSLARDVSPIHELRAFRELKRLIRAERPDILHLNSSKAGALGALAGRLAGVPRIVFTAHGWPHRERRGLLMGLFVRLSSWLTILLAHQVIAVSACDYRTAPVLASRKKITIVRNGIVPFPLSPRIAARQALIARAPCLQATVPWLLMLAELHTNKGIDIAITALSQLTDFPEAALVVLGEGEEREALDRQAKELGVADRVALIGFVEDARSYLSAADVFLMPSRKEGFPMALLEAGSAGVPVVASDVGGIPEIIRSDETGLLIPSGDPAALASALDELLSDSPRAASFGTELQRNVRSVFSEDAMVEQTAAAYAPQR
jgi:glycosyltransferase involved in cell wall biosynthesis